MKSVYLSSNENDLNRVYDADTRSRIAAMTQVSGTLTDPATAASDAEIVFSTWGMFDLPKERFPNVKYCFYAAGSVQYFARPLLQRGIRVFSAWQANAVPVAQYTVSQVLLSLKGYFQVQPKTRTARKDAQALFLHYPCIYRAKVGLLGYGAIGQKVAKLLRDCDLDVYAADPLLTQERARDAGITKSDFETIFAECDVISNHLPNLPATQGIITREMLLSMKPFATFINTGRGPQLSEQDLYDALTLVPTRTALLDVMTDEANSDTNPLNTLPNCFITPHIAGSAGNEVRRMGLYMADECERMLKGEKCLYEVTTKMLETMA